MYLPSLQKTIMPPSRSLRHLAGLAFFVIATLYLLRAIFSSPSSSSSSPSSNTNPAIALSRTKIIQNAGSKVNLKDKAVVVASTKGTDTSWVKKHLPDWKPYIYVVNDKKAPLHTERNKGREANAYLTYILDNYHRLPATIVFVHDHFTAHHVDNLFPNTAESIKALRLEHVQHEGYVSLRCMDEPGCICAPMQKWNQRIDHVQDVWPTFFPGTHVPPVILSPCCAQFAVSRAQVLARSRDEYVRMYDWLQETPLHDNVSGRVFEYLWHIIFGREAVHCVEEDKCYCDTYGQCDEDGIHGLGSYYVEWPGVDVGHKRGFWPSEHDYLKDATCAKWKAPSPYDLLP